MRDQSKVKDRHGSRRDGRAVYLASQGDAAAVAAREISLSRLNTGFKGYIRSFSEQMDQRYRRTLFERDRLLIYARDWESVQTSVLVDGAIRGLSNDSTAQLPQIRCNDSRALDEINRTLDRIRYWELRPQLMYLLNLLGDQFSYCHINYAPSRKWNKGEIEMFVPVPAHTMFRLDNERGLFENAERSYMQVPSVEISPLYSQFKEGSLLWKSDGYFIAGGLYGQLYDGYRSQFGGERDRIYFSAEEVVHARMNPFLKPMPDGYGLSAMRSARVVSDVVQMSLQDMAIARKLATFNRLHHQLGASITKEDYETYKKEIEETESSPWEEYVTRGDIKINPVDAQNYQLREIDDLHLQIDLLELGIGYPLAVLGFRAGRVTGEVLDRLEQRLVATIRAQNDLEEWQLLRPICWRALFLAGKADVEFDVIWPRGPRLGDMNKFAKMIYTAVQLNMISREDATKLLHDWDDRQWGENWNRILKEIEAIGPVKTLQSRPESSGKGKKGVEKSPSEDQDISDAEGISDEA